MYQTLSRKEHWFHPLCAFYKFVTCISQGIYVELTDKIAHRYGPNSEEIKETVRQVDSEISHLLARLQQRHLQDKVNIMIVSDHGMSYVAPENTINTTHYIDPADTIAIIGGNTIAGVLPVDGLAEKVRPGIVVPLSRIGFRGIRRGLVVTMPGSQAWVCKLESPLDPQAGWPGRYINVRGCGGLSMILLQLKDPLELFVRRRESSRFRVSISSRYDLSCWKRRKKPIPSFLRFRIFNFVLFCHFRPYEIEIKIALKIDFVLHIFFPHFCIHIFRSFYISK